MKILSALQIKAWDQYTIQQEPIAPIDLMERAAEACTRWVLDHFTAKSYYLFCGPGNNGGDGLAIARLLYQKGATVTVYIANVGTKKSEDFITNLQRLKYLPGIPVYELSSEKEPPLPSQHAIIIDALFGTGLTRKLENWASKTVEWINSLPNKIIAIDLPSGLQCDASSKNTAVVQAHYTLTFQCLKMALLMAENESSFGEIKVLDIGLRPVYLPSVETDYTLISADLFRSIHRPRKQHAHKGIFGHALIIAGSYGKMGAAVLSTKACLRSGAGLVSTHVPGKGVNIIQISAPEAMCRPDLNQEVVSSINYPLETYTALGVGPGLGTAAPTQELIAHIIHEYRKPLVLDADALNILSTNKNLINQLPENSILTPHPKEFSRLFGESLNDFDRVRLAIQKSAELKIIIVLKGHHTLIATPSGKAWFNTTGNAGMATGGSGDVLTGIITGLLAQGYPPADAAIAGVYLHGMAGDSAAAQYGMDAMIAGDLISALQQPIR